MRCCSARCCSANSAATAFIRALRSALRRARASLLSLRVSSLESDESEELVELDEWRSSFLRCCFFFFSLMTSASTTAAATTATSSLTMGAIGSSLITTAGWACAAIGSYFYYCWFFNYEARMSFSNCWTDLACALLGGGTSMVTFF